MKLPLHTVPLYLFSNSTTCITWHVFVSFGRELVLNNPVNQFIILVFVINKIGKTKTDNIIVDDLKIYILVFVAFKKQNSYC